MIRRKLFKFSATIASLVIACVMLEIGSYVIVQYLSRSGTTKVLFYQPPSLSVEEYGDYLRRRDPELGWPALDDIGGDRYDRSGSRHVPSFPEPGEECISVYGDSFTYASDVSHDDAWANILAENLGCRIGNFGVGGYGTDQALLRLKSNKSDRAPVTVLGLYPTDVMRNLTHNAYFLQRGYPTGFKPRYIIGAKGLELLPMPQVAAGDLTDFLESPEKWLDNDVFLPGTKFGPSRVQFPYTLALVKTVFHLRVINRILGRPSWVTYIEHGHPSGGLDVLMGIVDEYQKECQQRGKRCFVLLFPTPQSYEFQLEHGESSLQTVIDGLVERNMPYLNLAARLSKRMEGQSYCDLIGKPDSCNGHFNADGNRVVAGVIQEFIIEREFLSGADTGRNGNNIQVY